MNKIFSTILKSKYKWWLLMLIVLTVTISVIYSIATQNDILDVLIISVLVSLLINLVSSFVTIVFIEERDHREMVHIELMRQSVVIGKLVNSIRDYNDFFANVYKATSVDKIADINERSKNIFYETDNFIDHINMLDFNKEGYLTKYQALTEMRTSFQQCDFAINNYSWFEIFIRATKTYINKIYSIQENYLFCLSNIVLIESINRISGKMERVVCDNFDHLREIPNMMFGEDTNICELYPNGKKMKSAYTYLQTLDTISTTINLMTEINKLTNKNNFSINPVLFTAVNASPIIGSGIDDEIFNSLR